MAGAGVIAGRTMRQARCGVKGLSKRQGLSKRLEQKQGCHAVYSLPLGPRHRLLKNNGGQLPAIPSIS